MINLCNKTFVIWRFLTCGEGTRVASDPLESPPSVSVLHIPEKPQPCFLSALYMHREDNVWETVLVKVAGASHQWVYSDLGAVQSALRAPPRQD